MSNIQTISAMLNSPIGNIFQNKEYFEKYFKEKYQSDSILQYSFKYFVNK